MTERSSDAELIARMRDGSRSALNEALGKFREGLIRVVRAKLRDSNVPNAKVDPSDVVNSALVVASQDILGSNSVELASAVHLWRLLCRIAMHKCVDHIRHEYAEKRGGRGVVSESALECGDDAEFTRALDQFADSGASPEFNIICNEAFETLMSMYPEDSDEFRIVELQLAGFESGVEISKQWKALNGGVGRSVPTINRRRREMKEKWNTLGYDLNPF